jgi:hypothetical protein
VKNDDADEGEEWYHEWKLQFYPYGDLDNDQVISLNRPEINGCMRAEKRKKRARRDFYRQVTLVWYESL